MKLLDKLLAPKYVVEITDLHTNKKISKTIKAKHESINLIIGRNSSQTTEFLKNEIKLNPYANDIGTTIANHHGIINILNYDHTKSVRYTNLGRHDSTLVAGKSVSESVASNGLVTRCDNENVITKTVYKNDIVALLNNSELFIPAKNTFNGGSHFKIKVYKK